MVYTRRNDLTVFIPNVFESLFVQIQLHAKKTTILGVIYLPNTQPLADIDICIDQLKVLKQDECAAHREYC